LDCTVKVVDGFATSVEKKLLGKRDGRVKLAGLLVMSVSLAISQSFVASGTGLAIAICFLMFSGIPLDTALRNLGRANFFILLIWLVTPFTTPGRELFALGPLHITLEGCEISSLVTIKSNAIIIMSMALVGNMPVPEAGRALQRLRVPEKLCLILVFAYRHIFIMAREYNRLATAAKVRCFNPGTNLRTYRTYAYLAAMTIARSWNRAEKIRQAMSLRGFENRFFILEEKSLDMGDWLFALLSFMLAMLFFLL